MGETTDPVNASGTNAGGVNPDNASADEPQTTEEIRDSIEQTRSELSDTVDAIQEKLSPAHITQQVKEATVEKAREVTQADTQKIKAVTGHSGGSTDQDNTISSDASGASSSVMKDKGKLAVNWIKAHPVPTGLILFVLFWLIKRKLNSNREYESVVEIDD